MMHIYLDAFSVTDCIDFIIHAVFFSFIINVLKFNVIMLCFMHFNSYWLLKLFVGELW